MSLDLRKHYSNIDPDELALYIIVIIFASAHLSLIVRYFLRLSLYFEKLQKEIRKHIDQYHMENSQGSQATPDDDVASQKKGGIGSAEKPQNQ